MEQRMQDDAVISQEAVTWVSILPTAGARERAEFVVWLKTSRKHAVEYLSVLALYDHYLSPEAKRQLDVEALLAESEAAASSVVVTLPVRMRLADNSATSEAASGGSPSLPRTSRAFKRVTTVAAAVTAAVLLGIVLAWVKESRGASYQAAAGETRSLRLDDGSVVQLNASSTIRVHMSAEGRDIDLERGEAFFKVAHEARPFRVHAGDTMIQALGTQFNVRRAAQGTTIAVIEGRIGIRARTTALPESSAQDPLAEVSAGEGARISSDGAVTRLSTIAPERSASWRQQTLVFSDDTLAFVVEEFNRHNARQVRIEGEALKAKRVHGVFDADAPESFLRSVDAMTGVVVEHRQDVIIIRAQGTEERRRDHVVP